MRRKFKKPSYVWFLEFQKRGAPHLHVLWSIGVPNLELTHTSATLWLKAQKLGDWKYSRLSDGQQLSTYQTALSVAQHEKSWENVKSENGAKKYVTKYCTKLEQKLVPKDFAMVGRFWGTSRDVGKFQGELMAATESQVREILGYHGIPEERWGFLPRHIWFNDE